VAALALVRHEGSGSGALDVAIAHALLQRVSAGAAAPTLRLYRPAPTVAFGRLDALRPGFAAAVRAAREHGFQPVLRAPGGQASAYQEESVVLDLVMADADAITGVQTRFAELADLLAGALRSLGVDARVGAVPGEYCPGAHSVNAGGRVKLVGTAQRIVKGGWLFAASVVVREPEPVRAVLEAVYDRLGVAWDPSTVGSVADAVPAVARAGVEDAFVRAFSERHRLAPAPLDAATVAAARRLAPAHRLA
jgi:lipoate-protein ligase A